MFYNKQSPLKFFLEPTDPPGAGSGGGAGDGVAGGAGGGGNHNTGSGAGAGDNGAGGSDGAGGANNPSGTNPNNPGPKSVFNMGKDQGQDPAPVVPENYEFNIGEGLELTDDLKNRFTEIAKGAKLTQSQADALIKMHSDIMLDHMKQTEEKVNGWVKECEKQGYLSEQNLGYAKSAINYFGGSEAMNALVETGAINHPAVFKMVMTIGELISEDVPPAGAAPKAPKSSADIMFPSSNYD